VSLQKIVSRALSRCFYCARNPVYAFGTRKVSNSGGPVRQIGEERVQFRLHFRRVSAEQAGHQAGKTENAGPRKGFLRKPSLKEKRLRNKILGKRVNDVDIKIAAYKILHPYQGDTYCALRWLSAQATSRPAHQFMQIGCWVESIGCRSRTATVLARILLCSSLTSSGSSTMGVLRIRLSST
jgi:hypothetical protein